MLQFITWDADPMLIDSFIQIRWYGLMFAIGFWLGYQIMYKIFRHEGAPERWLGILFLWVVAGTVIGARLGHVCFYEWEWYSAHPEKILAIWEGGLASHGGTIGIMIAIVFFSIFTTKRSPLWTCDRLAIPIALVAAMIRFGNLMNSEIYGHPTDMPWGFIFVRGHEFPMTPCHPTQIYEALCYLALFGLLMWMYWKKNAERRPGLLLGIFFVGIFASRFLIEFVKNNQVDFEQNMTLNMGQWLSVPFVILGAVLIIYAMLRRPVEISFPNKFADENQKDI